MCRSGKHSKYLRLLFKLNRKISASESKMLVFFCMLKFTGQKLLMECPSTREERKHYEVEKTDKCMTSSTANENNGDNTQSFDATWPAEYFPASKWIRIISFGEIYSDP